MAATNRVLEQQIEHGRFRADLYDRIAAYPFDAPGVAPASDSEATSGRERRRRPLADPSLEPCERVSTKSKKAAIEEALAVNGGVWAAAARDLGLHRSNLHWLARRPRLGAPDRAP